MLDFPRSTQCSNYGKLHAFNDADMIYYEATLSNSSRECVCVCVSVYGII